MPSTSAISNHLPGPKGIPFLGNLLQFEKDPLRTYLKFWQQYGDRFQIKLGTMDSVALAHPEDVHYVLVKNQKNFNKGVAYDGFRLLVGQGLVTSEGELWRQQRRLMQPTFTPKAITQFFDMMVEVTERMLDQWEPLAKQHTSVAVDDQIRQLTMSIIGRAMFGVDFGEELAMVGDAFQCVFEAISRRSQELPIPLGLPTPKNLRIRKHMKVLNRFIEEQIALASTAKQASEAADKTLLSILLHARDDETQAQMSHQQLRDEVVTLFFAGFETTARSLTWALYLLSRHPEIATKVAAEADAVFGGRRPTVPDLFRLTYTRQVVDETLRLYPPTALLPRQTREADEIAGYTIPPQTVIMLIPYLVHRAPGIWPDPERFDPDRFLPEIADQRPKAAYIPFASGPRVCIGNNFALLEMVLALAMAATRYRWTQTEVAPIPWEFVATIRPSRVLHLRFELR